MKDNGMIGKYVVVRCYLAGIHAGVLEAHEGQECILKESRRLWYWKPAKGGLLSSVVNHGLDKRSKVGEPQPRIHLTEACEISLCTGKAEMSIRSQPNSHE